MRTIDYAVPQGFAGKKLYSFLKGGLHLSSRLIRSLKQCENGLQINGAHARTIDLLRAGDRVTITIPDDAGGAVPGASLPDVVYEDADLLIVNKPALLPIHESHNHQGDTLANCVALYLQKQGRTATFRAVGRLDKGTSGLVVCALNSHAAARLSGQIEKTYLAVATGTYAGSGTIDAPIYRPDPMKTLRTVDPRGSFAVTHWTALDSKNGLTLLEIHLETGRTHQIRVHFASQGTPLFGDRMYGTPSARLAHQALHCSRVRLLHPITGEPVEVTAPPPWSFEELAE